MSFEQDDLARLRAAEEVDIETQAPDGPVHRTTIWVMVDGDDTFVRSVRGENGRWYREATANPAVGLHVDGRRLAATAIPATDPESIERTNRALREKYEGIEGYAPMLEPDVLGTTLRLEPT
ncbi:MAG TPA: nitroreductase/quinone reductase family protein [Candidatus Limnocylindrales bacterium]|nr:nitroreductase/quinone reductase family protein [Candidatus Limnocylindrales bacterium]